ADAQSEAPATTSIVLGGAVIVQMLKPAEVKNFDEYAQEIVIPYLSTKLQTASRVDLEDKQFVITDEEVVLSKSPLPDLDSLAPCSHDEADSRMLLHASHAAQNGHYKIM
ncbi:hypothetical protein LSAT2_012715, partial [Lamellibrachia satsuma]